MLSHDAEHDLFPILNPIPATPLLSTQTGLQDCYQNGWSMYFFLSPSATSRMPRWTRLPLGGKVHLDLDFVAPSALQLHLIPRPLNIHLEHMLIILRYCDRL